MIHLIDKFYNDIQGKFFGLVDEFVSSIVISNSGKKLVNNWDEIIDHLDNINLELIKIFNSEDEDIEPEAEDYIKLAALNIVFAIMYKLDEKYDINEVIRESDEG